MCLKDSESAFVRFILADSFICFSPQLWEVYGERRCIRTFIGELSYIFIWQTLLSVNKSWYEMVTEYSPPKYNTSSTTMGHQQTCWREICSRSEIYAAFWEMHSSDRLWAQHYWDTNDTSADRWKKVYGFLFFSFFFNGVWVEGCRLMVCRSLLCPSQRRLTVWIEIVCSCGYACQLLHGICIIQQPGVLRGARAKGEGTRHGEESTPRKREHGSGGVLEICSMLWRAY